MPSRVQLKLILFLLFSLSGTSQVFALGGDETSQGTIPLPEKNFEVMVTDVKGVKTSASRVSWNGKIFFQGKRGEALTTVPFEKIASVKLDSEADAPAGSIASFVELKSGENIKLDIDSGSKCYGETDFGQFEIYIRDIGSIQFK